ncbi:response regulator [Methanospirillum hungatei]|uniref:response regulator n=1 Tax=Methanospirillum hungatei TaxID=2203 RepID=UPI0026EA4EBB|nr:response regulator [Methanospirillum hungatei]MCA1916036.1 response regulator [Methanospirillum hungatei]
MTRVLYIDDEITLLTLTQIYLKEEANLDVEVAASAEEGLKLLRSESFDAIISDYDMPDMDGIELLKCVRKENPTIPFIVFTGKGREEIVIEALNYGADFYLQKGGDPKPLFTELANAIRHLVRRSQAEDSAMQHMQYWKKVQESISRKLEDIENSAHALTTITEGLFEGQEHIQKILMRTQEIHEELHNQYKPEMK